MSENYLHVTCAIIERDGCILAAQRSRTMAMPLKWEFPGGKIKPGETPEHCLCREIAEELAIKVAVTWLPREKLVSLDWAAADRPVLETYLQFAGQETP